MESEVNKPDEIGQILWEEIKNDVLLQMHEMVSVI